MMRNRLNRKKNQTSDFSDFYFPSYGHFCLFLPLIFDEFFTITRKIKNRVKTERGGFCISIVGKNPKGDHISKAKNLKINLTTFEKNIYIFFVDILSVDILSVRHFVC